MRSRADPVGYWLRGGEASELLIPSGYTPLSKNETVRKCVHKIADLVSSMTIMLMENGQNGDVRIKDELARKLDVSPSQAMTRKNFIYKLVTDMLINGNAICYPRFQNGLLDRFEIWNTDGVSYAKTEDGYSIRKAGLLFDSSELLHFVFMPDDEDTFKGNGCVLFIKKTVENLIQAEYTKTGFLQSKWKPSLIISIPADAQELEDEAVRSKILESYTKTTNAGDPWLIPAGEIDVKTVQPLTLNDLAIQDSITLDLKSIAMALGVPPFLVGIGEFNRAAYNHFVASVLMPIAINMQQEFTRKLLLSPSRYFKFNPKSLMQYDLNEKVDFVKAMVSGGMLNRNEGRNEFDYSPVDNAGMNEYIVLENYVPVDKVGEQKKLKGAENG